PSIRDSLRFDLVFGGVTESGKESLILGIVVGAVAQVFAEFGDRVAGSVGDGDTIPRRPRIAASSAIDVSSVRGGRGFRRGKKILRVGSARRHRSSLQRAVEAASLRYRSGDVNTVRRNQFRIRYLGCH